MYSQQLSVPTAAGVRVSCSSYNAHVGHLMLPHVAPSPLPQTMSAAIKQRMASQPMASRAGGATVRPGEGRSVKTDKSSCC